MDTRVKQLLSTVALAAVNLLLGCADPDEDLRCHDNGDCELDEECDVDTGICVPCCVDPPRFITIQDLDPNDTNVLYEDEDDTDPAIEGFQYTITVATEDFPAGTEITLCKVVDDTEKDCVSSMFSDNGDEISVAFTDYTLDYGMQTLGVKVVYENGEARYSVEVLAVASNECVVSITSPQDSVTLTADDDKDAAKVELQYDVIAGITDVQAGNVCTLVVGDRPAVEAAPIGYTVVFEDVDLPTSPGAGSLTLTVECTNNAGAACEDSVAIAVVP